MLVRLVMLIPLINDKLTRYISINVIPFLRVDITFTNRIILDLPFMLVTS